MKNFIQWCRRYISLMSLLVIGFMTYTMFLQDNSLFKYMEYSHSIDSLRTEIRGYNDTLVHYHKMNSLLSTDPEVMERVVREEYRMHRPGEDVYVFE